MNIKRDDIDDPTSRDTIDLCYKLLFYSLQNVKAHIAITNKMKFVELKWWTQKKRENKFEFIIYV